MPTPIGTPLKNPKHEKFAQLVANGTSKREAAIKVGFGKKNASSQGTNLAKSPKVSQRIAELHNLVIDKTVTETAITRTWVLDKLRENVERALQVIPVKDSEGNETGEFRYEGNVVNRGLELLGKHLGMFEGKPEDAKPVTRVTYEWVMPKAETDEGTIPSRPEFSEEARVQ